MPASGPDVTHFTARPFNTWGCGYIASQAALAAYRAGRLRRVIAPSFVPGEIPDSLIHVAPPGFWWAALQRLPYRLKVRFALDFLFRDNELDWKSRRLVPEGGIFHAWSHQGLFSMRRARKLGARLVLERPNTHPLEMTRLVRREYRRFGAPGRVDAPFEVRKCLAEHALADRIVVCSQFARESHLRHGIPDEKLRVINYGVDTETFSPGEKRDNVFRVVFCGMVCLRKGIQYLLQAWEELAMPGAELLVLGLVLPDAVPLMERYRDLPGLRIQGHVDSRTELADLYRQGSVFVFPSVEDGFGMVVTEAMACGIPVVISDHTGAKDVVQDGVNGFVVPTYDVQALKDRTLTLRDDPALCRSMGEAARETALQNTWRHYGEKLLRVYDELAD
jgi:glycosyltransferase involved in cell wall biosynthesis